MSYAGESPLGAAAGAECHGSPACSDEMRVEGSSFMRVSGDERPVYDEGMTRSIGELMGRTRGSG